MNHSPQLAVALQDTGDALNLIGRLVVGSHGMSGLEWGQAANLLEGAAARIRATHAPGSGVYMGSKLKPSGYDCYTVALPDEPLFTLLGRDDSAPEVIEEWARKRAAAVERGDRPTDDNNKVVEAYALAIAMREWRAERFAAWRSEPEVEAVVE